MSAQVSYPGVYIVETAPGAPIEGVGTSTAAFIGPAPQGDIRTPVKLTSFDQFRTTFGSDPLPGFYLWYAVRGFFDNGGTVCYVARASNGSYHSRDLKNTAGLVVLKLRARQPGDAAISVKIDTEHALTAANTKLYRPTGNLKGTVSDRTVTLKPGAAALFKPGDVITIANAGERARIIRVNGDNLTIEAPMANAYADGNTVRLANTQPGDRTFRIVSSVALPAGGLVEGTMLTIKQGGTTDTQIVDTIQTEYLTGTNVSYRVTFRSGVKHGFNMGADATVQSEEFALSVTVPAGVPPLHGLSMVASHPNYVVRKVNDDPYLPVVVELPTPAPAAAPPLNLPAALAASPLAGGAPETLTTLADVDYTNALDTLRDVDDINMIAIPDRITAVVQQAMIAHCEQLMDRFAVLDARAGLKPFGATGSIEAQRREVDSARGYAALYYPWLQVPPAFRGEPLDVPPSGHICGIISRSDQSRGVHKAPANEFVKGAFGVVQPMGDIDHGQLNLQGINVVRVFQGGGRPILYGARTTATDKNWQQINIRRLFLFLEESIQEGIRWAVFEPNNLQLWQKLRRSIGDFLERARRDGALFGAKPEHAYYVRIDEALNPFSEQQLGRLNIEVGVRPAFAAEFIIVTIGIWAGGSDTSES